MTSTHSAVIKRAVENGGAKGKSRLYGIGSMMSVTTCGSENIVYHYENRGDGMLIDHASAYYLTQSGRCCNIILVLGADIMLKLPETGYQMHVKSGDLAAFLAKEQLHKLERISTAAEVATIFTLWTNKARSMELLEKTQAELGIVRPEPKQENQALKDEVLEAMKESPNSVSIPIATIPTVVASDNSSMAMTS
jgi:hypothetical protein